MPIIQKTYEPTERAQQIIALAKEAFEGAEEVRKRTRLSVDSATLCGQLLIQEQADVTKRLGKGTWESYYEITFAKTVPRRTAFHWMRLAKSSRIEAPPPPKQDQPKPVSAIAPATTTEIDPNSLRKGMLALHLFPAKKHEPSPLSGQAIAAPKLSTHLSLINRFSAWHSWFMAQNNGTLTQQQRQQLRLDFAPMRTMLDQLTA